MQRNTKMLALCRKWFFGKDPRILIQIKPWGVWSASIANNRTHARSLSYNLAIGFSKKVD
jgi:hypothetical protein